MCKSQCFLFPVHHLDVSRAPPADGGPPHRKVRSARLPEFSFVLKTYKHGSSSAALWLAPLSSRYFSIFQLIKRPCLFKYTYTGLYITDGKNIPFITREAVDSDWTRMVVGFMILQEHYPRDARRRCSHPGHTLTHIRIHDIHTLYPLDIWTCKSRGVEDVTLFTCSHFLFPLFGNS